MPTQDPEDQPGGKQAGGKGSRSIRLKSVGKRKLSYQEELDKSSDEKRIHHRRPLPPVPEAPPEDTEKRQ
jgi:hypothetical protein